MGPKHAQAMTPNQKSKRTRSRFGCHTCKRLKIKCSETKPKCDHCAKLNFVCDYSLRLNWGAREVVPKNQGIAIREQPNTSDNNKDFWFINTTVPKQKPSESNATDDSETSRDRSESAEYDDEHVKAEKSEALILRPSNTANVFVDASQNPAVNHNHQMVQFQAVPFSPSSVTHQEGWKFENSNQPFGPQGDSSYNTFIIPRSLSPLPDILFNDPNNHENFKFFCEHTAQLLVVAPKAIYTKNPFEKLLPRVALKNKSVFGVILAFAISHRCSLLRIPEPTVVINRLLSGALKELLTLLANPNTAFGDLPLTLAILLSSYEVFSCSDNMTSWKLHIEGARKMLMNRNMTLASVEKDTEASGLRGYQVAESNMSYFLFRWFAYIDVIANLATPLVPDQNSVNRKSVYTSPRGTSESQSPWVPPPFISYSADSREGDIDLLLGFNLKFLPLFDEMISLIINVNLTLRDVNGVPTIPPDLMERGMHIKEQLDMVQFVTETKKENLIPEKNILTTTNKLFYYTALLILYRRVFLVFRESAMVQDLCIKVKVEIERNLEAGSSAEVCSIFCIFTAGAEAVDRSLQLFFDARMQTIGAAGNASAAKAREVLAETWRTGKPWTEVVLEKGINMTFI